MNKNTSQKTGGCKAAKFQTLKIRIPADAAPLLAACAAFQNLKPEGYALAALRSCLECDSNIIGDSFRTEGIKL
jgi:hypothetical protein